MTLHSNISKKMSRKSHGPLVFPNNNKFNEMNWITFKNLVIMTAEMQGAMGYPDSFIKNPIMLMESKTIPSTVVPKSTS